jgi:hypothetical protein
MPDSGATRRSSGWRKTKKVSTANGWTVVSSTQPISFEKLLNGHDLIHESDAAVKDPNHPDTVKFLERQYAEVQNSLSHWNDDLRMIRTITIDSCYSITKVVCIGLGSLCRDSAFFRSRTLCQLVALSKICSKRKSFALPLASSRKIFRILSTM